MLGLEIFISPRKHEYSEIADIYLKEIMDTTNQIDWSGYRGWILCKEHFGIHWKWERYWRIWGGNYPDGWLNEIEYMDWGILTCGNFDDVPWITVTKRQMPSRKLSWDFWRWLKKNGHPMDFSSSHPMMDGKSCSI